MKIRKVIELLQDLEPDDNILVAWWDRNAFDFIKDEDAMADYSDYLEDQMDWSHTHDDLVRLYEENFT